MGLKISDLYGKLEQVEIIDVSQTEKDGKQICVLKVKHNTNQFDIGLYGEDIVSKILDKHGLQEKGKNFLKIPSSKIKDDGLVWINSIY